MKANVRAVGHWIDNAHDVVDPTIDVHGPADGALVARCVDGSADDVARAVESATVAAAGWAATSVTRRANILFAFRALLDAHRHELAELVSREHGKVMADALGEVGRGIEVVEYACGVGPLLSGSVTPQVATGVDIHSRRHPVGVVAGITPFNFPAMVPMWMFPVAIACGNAFVLKPSEKDPSVSIRVAELFAEAGLPEGVFNVVQGGRETVEALLDHPGVDAVSFVGSTPVARSIHERARDRGIRVQALGGAKNHMVVLPDADIDQAADAAVSAGFGSAGERCMAISVVVAVGDVGDRLVPAIAERMDGLEIGPGHVNRPDGSGPDMGALITAEHRDRVAGYVDRGCDAGAELVVDGRGLVVDGWEGGYWIGPCLFDRVEPSMELYTDEIFGPVLAVVRVDSFADAVDLVNSNPFANGTAIFTSDGGAARRYENEIEVGMVGINVPIPVPMAFYSFGGWRDSLFGEHHMHGEEGVRFFTRYKAVTTRWLDPSIRGVDLGFPTNQ